jgi:hypothetical protein
LAPKLPVYSSTVVDDVDQATGSIIGAASFSPDGKPQLAIDWKGDDPLTHETIDHSCALVEHGEMFSAWILFQLIERTDFMTKLDIINKTLSLIKNF